MAKQRRLSRQFNVLRKKAEKLIAQSGEEVSRISPKEDIQDVSRELSLYHIELEIQNNELIRAQEELEESHSRYLDLYENAPVGYLTFDKKGIVSDLNLTAARLLGIERTSLLKKPFSLLIAPESGDVFYFHRRDVLRSAGVHTCDLTLKRNEGEEQFFHAHLESIAIRTDRTAAIRTVLTDVTERKQSGEMILGQGERQYRLLFENMLNGFAHCQMLFDEDDKPVDFIYLAVNDAFQRLTGLEHVVGKRVTDVIPGIREAHPELLEIYGRVTLADRPERLEIRFTPLGRWFSISVYAAQKGQFWVLFDDITEHKRAEEALRKNNERLAILSDVTTQLLASKNPQDDVEGLFRRVMKYLDCHAFFNFLVDNQKQCLHLNAYDGISEEIARKMEWLDYGEAVCGTAALDGCRIVAEHIPTTPNPLTDLVRSFGITAYACHPLLFGSEVLGTLSFGTRSRLTFSEDDLSLMKAVADHVAIAVERERVQTKLAESKRLLDSIMEHVPEGITIADAPDVHIRMVSRYGREILGLGLEGMTAEKAREHLLVYHKDGVTPMAYEDLPLSRAILGGETIKNEELVQVNAKGQSFSLSYSAAPIHDSSGNITGGIVAWRDITSLARAEEALRVSEATMEAFFEASPGILNIEDDEFRYIKTDRFTPTYFGLNRETIVGKAVEELAPEFIRDHGAIMRRVIETGEPELNVEVKSPVPTRPGAMIYWSASYFRVPLPQGRRGIGIMGVDITAVKQAEEALRKAHDELEQRVLERTEALGKQAELLELARSAILVRDLENRITFWNRGAEEVYGWTRLEALGNVTHTFLKTRFPVPLDELMAALTREGRWEGELVHTTKDGRQITVLSRHALQKDVTGNPLAILEINLDITGRKQAEESLDIKSRTLEEVNTALKVLLKQRDEDKSELEDNILLNVKELMLPYVEKLKKSRLDAGQRSNVDILETNLKEITSSIIRKLHSFDLTPKEIEVASHLKDGRTTKEIAELLGVSPRAVECHRYNIRKKLGLNRKKTNLRSYLRFMP